MLLFRRLTTELCLGLIIVASALFIRGLSLEYTDLVDPTETRYASVGQEMYLSGDWVTPKLPMPEGLTPYLGKPPLHFWLVALSYSVFGVEEWTARLPSLLAAVLSILATFLFARRYFGNYSAVLAVLVLVSSGMFFFLSGACVVDTTLSALVALASLLLFQQLQLAQNPSRLYGFAAACVTALAFLCKGPVALVLIGLPLLLWAALTKNIKVLFRLPWIWMLFAFLILTLPWFLLNEQRNPGFIWYFVWNENIGRYLFKEYGDKYGSGHSRMYGTSWLMLFAAFLPWTFVLLYQIKKLGWAAFRNWLRNNPARLYAWCCGLSPAIFFTFVKQLHGMYLLPGVWGLSLVTGALLSESAHLHCRTTATPTRTVRALLAVWWSLLLLVGAFLAGSTDAIAEGLAVIVFGLVIASRIVTLTCYFSFMAWSTAAIILTYTIGIIGFTPYVEMTKSTESILKHALTLPYDSTRVPVLGICTRNTFSYYWLAKAWKVELSKEVLVRHVEPDTIDSSAVDFLLLDDRHAKQFAPSSMEHFAVSTRSGPWTLYVRKTLSQIEK